MMGLLKVVIEKSGTEQQQLTQLDIGSVRMKF